MPFYKKVFVALQLVIWLAVLWPGYAFIGASATPLILGLPFSFFWIILWVLIGFSGIYLLFYFDYSSFSSKQTMNAEIDAEGLFANNQDQIKG